MVNHDVSLKYCFQNNFTFSSTRNAQKSLLTLALGHFPWGKLSGTVHGDGLVVE